MAYGESLPWELTEEILSRLPPKSLVRFRAVSTQWNRLFKDKTFIRNHKNKMTPRFILVTTTSKIYSVSINPKKEIYSVNELALDIPGLETQRLRYLVGRNELLLCRMEKGAAIWNPWLKQTRWIEDDVNQNISKFVGVGHNNKSYMVLGFCRRTNDNRTLWKIYDFDSDAWKDQDRGSSNGKEGHPVRTIITDGNVSLNGNLYWVSYSKKASDGLSIMQYDFSKGKFKLFCDLPCGTYHRSNASALAVFKEDRFSLLKQCHATKNLEVWVTKNKINSESGDDVEWIKFMEVSSPDLPVLLQPGSNAHPSYFIEDQTLVVCFCENGRAWIYLLGENKLIRKIQIDHVDGPWHLQRTCTPTLVQVPLLVQKEETELQV